MARALRRGLRTRLGTGLGARCRMRRGPWAGLHHGLGRRPRRRRTRGDHRLVVVVRRTHHGRWRRRRKTTYAVAAADVALLGPSVPCAVVAVTTALRTPHVTRRQHASSRAGNHNGLLDNHRLRHYRLGHHGLGDNRLGHNRLLHHDGLLHHLRKHAHRKRRSADEAFSLLDHVNLLFWVLLTTLLYHTSAWTAIISAELS